MKTKTHPKFTKTEWEIIKHRLEVSDAIAEVIIEDGGEWTTEAITSQAKKLISMGAESVDMSNPLIEEIILDAIHGSTFSAAAYGAYQDGEISRQKLAAYEKAEYQLQERLPLT